MKVTIALDPNIFLAATLENSHYEGLVADLQDSQDYIRFAVDEDGIIFDELSALRTNPDIHFEIREWIEAIIRQESRYIKPLPTPVVKSKHEWLAEIGCKKTTETQLIGVCAEEGRDVRLIVVGKDINHVRFQSRGIHQESTRKQLIASYPYITIWDALRARRLLSDWLKNCPLPPSNQLELEDYLKEYRRRENQYLEFKQPDNSRSPADLTKSILIESMEELCGMANATGKGKLIVGIYEDPTTKLGEIRGFPLRYVNNKEKVKPKTEEEMKKILRQDYLSKFRPMFTLDELQFEFFEVYGQWNEQRLVLIFHLNLKFAVNCTYDGKKWIRVDTENLDPSKFIAA